MQVGLRRFSPSTLKWLADNVRRKGLTRYALAREICELEDWRNPRGELCVTNAYLALPQIAQALKIQLPRTQRNKAPDGAHAGSAIDAYPDTELTGRVDDFADLRLDQVSAEEYPEWCSMMQTHHPRGWAKRPGANIKYWITVSDCDRLGGISFCSAQWHQRARDAAIGWSPDARVANLDRLLENHRFLILPSVRVQNLASRVLALAANHVPRDWSERHNRRPQAIYTYLAPEHEGTCYRAAGWHHCPRVSEGLPDWRRRRVTTPCEVWIKPLSKDWRATLQHQPRAPLGQAGPLHQTKDMDWADVEWARCRHPDGRLRRRLITIGRAWQDKPGAPLMDIFPTPALQVAAYRLLANPGLSTHHVIEGHFEATVERCRAEQSVTSILVANTLSVASRAKVTGSFVSLHAGLAYAGDGRPLGLHYLNVDCGKAMPDTGTHWFTSLKSSAELASACPDTCIFASCDQPDDIWTMLQMACLGDQKLVIGINAHNCLQVIDRQGQHQDLRAVLAARPPVIATLPIKCPSLTGAAVDPSTDIRACMVDLVPPAHHAEQDPVKSLAIAMSDPNRASIDRLLLSTDTVADPTTIMRAVNLDPSRWRAGDFFKHLERSTRIADPRLKTSDALRKCIAFDTVCAWRALSIASTDTRVV